MNKPFSIVVLKPSIVLLNNSKNVRKYSHCLNCGVIGVTRCKREYTGIYKERILLVFNLAVIFPLTRPNQKYLNPEATILPRTYRSFAHNYEVRSTNTPGICTLTLCLHQRIL